MKRIYRLFLLLCICSVALLSLTGCNQPSKQPVTKTNTTQNSLSMEAIYKDTLQTLSQTQEISYALKDLDGSGTEELLVQSNTTLTVYTFEDSVVEIGSHDFVTGTLRLLYTGNENYPGIVCFTVGWGHSEIYEYLTIQNKQLHLTDVWTCEFSNDNKPKEILYCDDTQLIDLSKTAYTNNQDIAFQDFNR